MAASKKTTPKQIARKKPAARQGAIKKPAARQAAKKKITARAPAKKKTEASPPARKSNAGVNKSQPSRLALAASLDITGAVKLHSRLKQCAAKKCDVNLNAAEVTTIDTTGLQLLLCFVRQLRDNGNTVKWQSASEVLLNTAKLTGVEAELQLLEAAGQ